MKLLGSRGRPAGSPELCVGALERSYRRWVASRTIDPTGPTVAGSIDTATRDLGDYEAC